MGTGGLDLQAWRLAKVGTGPEKGGDWTSKGGTGPLRGLDLQGWGLDLQTSKTGDWTSKGGDWTSTGGEAEVLGMGARPREELALCPLLRGLAEPGHPPEKPFGPGDFKGS